MRLLFNVILFVLLPLADVLANALVSSRFDNFSQKDGLSNNVVQCVYQDAFGLMWFGTSQGLNVYDGYVFRSFKNEIGKPASLNGDLVRCVFQDSKKRFWVGTESGGLNLFDYEKESFSVVPLRNDNDGYSANCIVEDKKGRIWVASERGLMKLSGDGSLLEFVLFKDKDYKGLTGIRKICVDFDGNLWMSSTTQGLYFYSPDKEELRHVVLHGTRSASEEVQTVYQSKDGTIWVGTYYSGVFQVNPKTFVSKILDGFPVDERVSTVRSIVEDSEGILWFGTRGGLVGYNRKSGDYGIFVNDIDNEITLVHNSIIDLFVDLKGDLWVGTRGGISLKNQEKQNFRLIRESKNDSRYLNNDEVYAFIENKDAGEVWVGTESGGVNVFNLSTNTFKYITKKNGLSSNCIKCFMDDGNDFWVGTYMGGICVVDKKSLTVKRVFRHNVDDETSVLSNKVWDMHKSSDGKIWVATSKGLDLYDEKSSSFVHFKHVAHNTDVFWIKEDRDNTLWMGTLTEVIVFDPHSDKVTRFSDRTRSFLEDENGSFWLGTQDKGLALYDKHTGPVCYYSEEHGLANNFIQTINESSDGFIWITTTNGLSRFDRTSKTFKNYDGYDGLQDAHFLYNASCKLSDGSFIVGGINGFNIFDPLKVRANSYVPPVVFTDFKIYNKTVSIGKEVEKSIMFSDNIHIDYNQNMISFMFAALSYSKSAKNQYMYKMEGFDADWIYSGTQNHATYTNLNPGHYRFYVKGANCDGKWNETPKVINVYIKPPFWLTWWFKCLVAFIFLVVIIAVIRFYVHRAKLNNELMFEKTRSRKLHEIEMLKTNFFTNVSHELRTPLTLILGPVSQILKRTDIDNEIRNNASLAERNANQLLKLVNQLLDYRKAESGKLQVHYSSGDIVSYVDSIVKSFGNLADSKKISLEYNHFMDSLNLMFDEDKIQKICNNLLSNAIKYTDEGGKIYVCLNRVDQYKYQSEVVADSIEMIFLDNGVGISPENLGKIFNRFFQNSTSDTSLGTGIGLSITKEFVELMDGEIEVESELGKGTRFVIHLPIKLQETDVAECPDVDNADEKAKSAKRILLVVEDNEDLRKFLVSNFSGEYDVREADNGALAYEMAQEIVPDAVITDFIMPKMCGDELCRKIKKNERTSHIPVILLTAVTSKESEMESLKAGADDFITKPFDLGMLRQKLENLILMQENLKKKFNCDMILQPTNVVLMSPDERFLNKLMEVVEKFMSDPELDIERVAQEVGVSRMQLYRKVDALTNMTVKEFVRSVRIKRAMQLLEQKSLTVSEVAFEVGFKDVAYFRKCFKAQVGQNPSEILERNKPKE